MGPVSKKWFMRRKLHVSFIIVKPFQILISKMNLFLESSQFRTNRWKSGKKVISSKDASVKWIYGNRFQVNFKHLYFMSWNAQNSVTEYIEYIEKWQKLLLNVEIKKTNMSMSFKHVFS